MSETNNTELIVEARRLADPNFSLSVPNLAKRALNDLADALESLTATLTETEADLQASLEREKALRAAIDSAEHGIRGAIQRADWAQMDGRETRTLLRAATQVAFGSVGATLTETEADLQASRGREEGLQAEVARLKAAIIAAHYSDGFGSINLGYYRTQVTCICGDKVWWGEHEADPTRTEAWAAHIASYSPTTVTDEMVDRAASALDQNFNPDRWPVMAAMFRDYARTAIEAALHPVSTEGENRG